jgi:hypothetical protein
MEEDKIKNGWNKNIYDLFIESRDAKVVIKYPLKPTEFEIQSMIYESITGFCKRLDNECEIKSEVTVFIDDNVKMRFDLMLFSQQIPVCGIEVKRGGWVTNPDQSKKQLIKYQMFTRFTGIPVLYCYGEKDVDTVIDKAVKYL